MSYTMTKASTTQDFQKIAVLADQVWHHTYDALIGPEQTSYMIEKFQSAAVIQRDVEENGYAYLMTLKGDEVVGYCGIRREEQGKVFLSKVYVAPAYQKQGIAKAMILTLANECAQEGYTRMWLTVNRENQKAISAYLRLGFQNTGALVTEIGQGYVMDDYTMELNLTAL